MPMRDVSTSGREASQARARSINSSGIPTNTVATPGTGLSGGLESLIPKTAHPREARPQPISDIGAAPTAAERDDCRELPGSRLVVEGAHQTVGTYGVRDHTGITGCDRHDGPRADRPADFKREHILTHGNRSRGIQAEDGDRSEPGRVGGEREL